MSPHGYRPQQGSIKEDLTMAREQLVTALDMYTDACLKIRSARHQDSQSTGSPWSEIVSELSFLPLLKDRLQQATESLNQAYGLEYTKTILTYPPPIDKLPDEILVRIFQLVVVAQPRDLHLTGKYGVAAFPSYPDSIAHTCVRWSRVAFDYSPLWTDIYLASHPTHFNSILSRARLYAQRSGDLPINLHVTESEGHTDPSLDPKKNDVNRFFASVAHRTSSLEIVRDNTSISTIEHESLTGMLRGCSDMFTRLVVRSKGLPQYGFIGPFRENTGDWVMEDLTLEQIERGFTYLRVLHASQVFPRWTSTAYHGLVDLRLMSQHKYSHECPTIQTIEFVTILNASPRLRILYFGLNLEFDPNLPIVGPSVQLNDLEVLYVAASGCYGSDDAEYEIKCVMELISPGSKPLCLTLDFAGFYDSGPIETVKNFFMRSHIVKFRSKRGTPPPMQLLDCAPHLTHLVFDRCRYDTYNFKKAQSQIIKLDSWVIRDCLIYIEALEPLLQQYSAQSIVVSNCGLFSKGGALVKINDHDLGQWGFEFPDNVRCVNPDLSPDPTADWGNLE